MRSFLLAATLLCATPSWAFPTFVVRVDTSSVAGLHGSIDFNLNPGPVSSQLAASHISSFDSDAVLGSSASIGSVTGNLPASVDFANDFPFNDYFLDLVYGQTLVFTLILDGPGVAMPDGRSLSGSTFAFSLFGDTQGFVPILSSDQTNGYAYLVNLNLDGSATATSFISTNASSTIPEPSTPALLLLTISGLLVTQSKRLRRAARRLRSQTFGV